MTARFTIEHDQDGRYHYELRTRTGTTIMTGASCDSELACKRTIHDLRSLVAAAGLPGDGVTHRIIGSDAASSA